jgi:hypothetical protein
MENVILSEKQMVDTMWEHAQSSSNEELNHITQADRFKVIAKAQASHLLKILMEKCDKHWEENVDMYDGHVIKSRYNHRKDCPDCMAQIQRQVNG